MIDIERMIYYPQCVRGRGTPYHGRPHGEAQGVVRRQKERGKLAVRAFFVVFTEGTSEAR